ncbi:hypothetical protein SDC9_199902 [bioreactor metagenome]|uniref:Uncharacterized protein n=1 Tax=bioreactor metagenome TaxID=1076179 RepID=A0A645IMG4_9ZZZZ
MSGEVMRIKIAFAVAELARAGKRGVPKIDRHRLVKALLRVRRRRRKGDDNAVGLWRFAKKDDRLRQRKPRFRQADMFQRVSRRNRLHHRLRIGEADVLARVRDEPPRNDPRINPRV